MSVLREVFIQLQSVVCCAFCGPAQRVHYVDGAVRTLETGVRFLGMLSDLCGERVLCS